MSRRRVAAALFLGLSAPLAGCARCAGDPSGSSSTLATATTAASALAPLLPPRVPPPAPWSFTPVRGPLGMAVPDHCRYRAPLLTISLPLTTHFAADARSLGTLVVAETQADPARVLRSGAVALHAQGDTTPGPWVPWFDARGAPRLARSGERWVGAWDRPAASGDSEVLLFRGAEVETQGIGDGFAAADLSCGAARCALLTSRLARVAPAGASVVIFEPDAGKPARTLQIEPDEGTSNARPFGLAAVDGPRGVAAVLIDGGAAVFWNVEAEGGPAPFAHLAAELGVLDATLLGERPLVLAHGNVVDAAGCAREGADAAGAKVRFVRAGEPPIDVPTPGPPTLAALRPLARGALAVWVSPLGCGAERRVVYGVVLDATGAPLTAPLPLGDGETFALAASGAAVDLWIRHATELFWLQLTCEAP